MSGDFIGMCVTGGLLKTQHRTSMYILGDGVIRVLGIGVGAGIGLIVIVIISLIGSGLGELLNKIYYPKDDKEQVTIRQTFSSTFRDCCQVHHAPLKPPGPFLSSKAFWLLLSTFLTWPFNITFFSDQICRRDGTSFCPIVPYLIFLPTISILGADLWKRRSPEDALDWMRWNRGYTVTCGWSVAVLCLTGASICLREGAGDWPADGGSE